MRETKEVTYKRNVVTRVICDKCGKPVTSSKNYNAYDSGWFECKTGSMFPEGGSGDLYTLDLCEDCSRNLCSFLKENGYNVNHGEWDF